MTPLHNKGFTLIEVLVATLVAGVLLSALLVMYQQSLLFWRTQEAGLETTDNLRIGLDRMAREVRSAVSIADCNQSGADYLGFRNSGGKLVRYYHDPAGRQLLRIVDGGSNSVAEQVDGFEALCSAKGLVTLRLQGGWNEGRPVSVETSVWARAAGD